MSQYGVVVFYSLAEVDDDQPDWFRCARCGGPRTVALVGGRYEVVCHMCDTVNTRWVR